jgi:hypothetical protein
MPSESVKPFCCYLFDDVNACPNDAQGTIIYGPAPFDYTDACTAHVGDLLEPDKENTVIPLSLFHEGLSTSFTGNVNVVVLELI